MESNTSTNGIRIKYVEPKSDAKILASTLSQLQMLTSQIEILQKAVDVLTKGENPHIIPTKKGERIGVLEFYDEWDLKMALNGSKWGFAMLDLDNDLRGIIKHSDKSDEYINALEYVRDKLRELLADSDISLEDLY